jgi:DNA repair protein RadC
MKYELRQIDELKIIREPSGVFINSMKITTPTDVYEYAKDNLYKEDIDIYESVFLILLNRANVIINYVKISQGATNASIIDIKLVALYCVKSLAEAAILVHNHPSGNLVASKSDISTTKKVEEILKLMNIKLFDHIIITNKNYNSI